MALPLNGKEESKCGYWDSSIWGHTQKYLGGEGSPTQCLGACLVCSEMSLGRLHRTCSISPWKQCLWSHGESEANFLWATWALRTPLSSYLPNPFVNLQHPGVQLGHRETGHLRHDRLHFCLLLSQLLHDDVGQGAPVGQGSRKGAMLGLR